MSKPLTCPACRRRFSLTPAQISLCQEYRALPPSLCPRCREKLRQASLAFDYGPVPRRRTRHGRGYFQRQGGYYSQRT